MQLINDTHARKKAIAAGEYSLTNHISSLFDLIKSKEGLNIFLSLYPDSAIGRAKQIERKIRAGGGGRLAGMVVGIKDVLALEGERTTCASKILEEFESVYTATAVQRLLDEDAVIIGKTNCDEFAMGSSNENSAFGNVKNPVNPSYVPGGSSGGSAAAVAAGLCDASLGTDTGGSIRQPAAFCGIYGLKPTYSRVSRFGLTAFASSFDTVGPFAANLRDLALLLEVIAGEDSRDETCSDSPLPAFSQLPPNKKIRIGIPREYIHESLQTEIRTALDSAADMLSQAGHEVSFVSLPQTDFAIAAYYILTTAEASSNLARYDGARYGKRAPEPVNLQEMYARSRSDGFGKEVKRRIMLGTYVLSSGYYDAYYKKAQQVRRLIMNDFLLAFKEVDILLAPVTPSTAFRLGEKTTDPLAMYLADIYTISANLAGIPGLAIPFGVDSNSLPIGLQLMGPHFSEDILLSAAQDLSGL